MLRIVFDFPGRRYHATPWGHHVNEGLVEWPPSPWRILRALLATGYTKLGWEHVPAEMLGIIDACSMVEPVYRLPTATKGHTRHYMPVGDLDKKRGEPKTSKVIDAFVRPTGPLVVGWPIQLAPNQMSLLAELLARLCYLGRAESRVRAALLSGQEALPDGMEVSTTRRHSDDEPVRLLTPMPADSYANWCRETEGVPETLLGVLEASTTDLQRDGWTAPPGSRELIYWRPAAVFSPSASRQFARHAIVEGADTAMFALGTDRKRDVLPLIERALPTMALFRRALLSKVGDEQQMGGCVELTGKDENCEPLHSDHHRHSHFIPLSLDTGNRGRIDHVLVHSAMGFGHVAQRAMRQLRKTWAKGIDDLAVTLIGLGPRDDFVTVGGLEIDELATSRVWRSKTPFVPPRHIKARGKDSLVEQVKEELRRRGLPELSHDPVFTVPTSRDAASDERLRRFRHFVRTARGRDKKAPPAGLFHITMTLVSPAKGPICLGWGSHFGLGLFGSQFSD
ncbi:MAG: type I-U CRISPR-associated protein Cas5/Cas6 [Planctomycetes bacterium]|nr:type I-U CRISPR-associated protein Cas5/Cas6 [Planctomycetota bacterium]